MSDKAHEMVNEKVDKKPIRKPKNKSIVLYNPFIMLDFLNPTCKQEFDRDLLKYVDIPTGEYTDSVLVFDVKEVRIKSFYETKTLIKIGEEEELIPTVTIVFSDNTKEVTKLSIADFMTVFLPEYLLKLNQIFPSETETCKT
jgi:hypothetical protein